MAGEEASLSKTKEKEEQKIIKRKGIK